MYTIDKNAHYFCQMERYEMVLPMFGIGICSHNNTDWVECVIVEDRYKVEDGYKVTLKPLDPNFASRDFYQDSFKLLMRRNYIVPKTDEMMLKRVEWKEKLSHGIYVQHSATIICNQDGTPLFE